MRLHRITPLLVTALVAALLGAAPAPAAAPHHPLGGSVNTSTGPNETSTVTSGKYSNDVRSADLYFNTETMNPNDYKVMVFTLMSVRAMTNKGTKTNRLVACAAMSADHMSAVRERLEDSTLPTEQIQAFAGTRGAAYALLCMNMARMMAEIEAEPPPARAARSKCDVVAAKVRVRTERTEDGGYRLVPTSKITDGTKALAVKATCKGRGTKTTMRIVPKKKGPLNRVAGKKIVVGVVNPSTADGDADITVGFKGR